MNDRVVVPIHRVTVSIAGAIELPVEYELLRGATVANLVNQAGGLTPYAKRQRMMVRQPDVNGDYTSMAVTFEEGMLVTLRDNAVLRSYGCGSAIVVEGAVFGEPTWHSFTSWTRPAAACAPRRSTPRRPTATS